MLLYHDIFLNAEQLIPTHLEWSFASIWSTQIENEIENLFEE